MAHAPDEAQTTSPAYDGSSITSRLRKQTVVTEFLVRNPWAKDQARSSGPTASATPQKQPASSSQPAAAPREAVRPQEATGTSSRRRKDEPSPPSAWRILRPGKPVLSAPDGAAWLKWWTDLAGKAAAEGRISELRALYEANTATWDDIALASPETEAVMAKTAQAVRTALDG